VRKRGYRLYNRKKGRKKGGPEMEKEVKKGDMMQRWPATLFLVGIISHSEPTKTTIKTPHF
jgi:hypothetical protein